MEPLKLEKIAPIGKSSGYAFCNPGGLQLLTHDVYPEADVLAGREARDLRVKLGLGARDVAKALGIPVLDVMNIEFGRVRFDRKEYAARLEKAAAR